MNTIKLYGADWCPDCLRAKSYLKENNITFEFVNVDLDKEATARVESINNGKRIILTVLINDKPFTNPENPTLASVLVINDMGRVVLFGADWCPDCKREKTF
jgi:thioredoxin reductase (NADPH)